MNVKIQTNLQLLFSLLEVQVVGGLNGFNFETGLFSPLLCYYSNSILIWSQFKQGQEKVGLFLKHGKT